jgi:L-asparaginase II
VNRSCVEVWRGELVESRHRVSVAVVDGEGRLRAHAGDTAMLVYARSSIKPMQALPLIEDEIIERFGLTDAELALACASHSGEPRHIDGVRSMLAKIGLREDALACGPHAPFHDGSATELRRRGIEPGRVHNNCSGKHAGMLALARGNQWPVAGYQEHSHPVQQRMLEVIAEWSGVPAEDVSMAVDGCGVTTFALPLQRLAHAFARLATAARRGADAPTRVVQAMTRHPEMVGGTDRLCTNLMRVAAGRMFVKVGAEGVYCAGVPGAELGVALKIEDGATRAAEPALVAVLQQLALLTDEDLAALDGYATPAVHNTRGELVGCVRAEIDLEPGD